VSVQDQRPRTAAVHAEADACALLARTAARLAEADDLALPDALTALVAGLGLRSAVLRDSADGEVLAVSGDVVHAVPLSRERSHGPQGVVEVPVHVSGRPLAALTVVGARPSHLPVLRAAAAVLALGLRRTAVPHLPLSLLAAADAEADAAADALHDGPVQQLVVARYAADAAVRGGDVVTVRDAVQASLVALRRTLWLLRPRGGGVDGLASALSQLSERLQQADRPGLLLDVDASACARLTPQAASVCYRLVQELAGPEGGSATAVRVRGRRDTVLLELDGEADAVLAASQLWTARARALGADLVLPGPDGGRVVMVLPVSPLDPPHAGTDEPRRSP
jgi:signal transduction histidine kinase